MVSLDDKFVKRPGRWATWLAFRSTLTSAVAIGAAWVVKTMALPAISEQTADLKLPGLLGSELLPLLGAWLPAVGVPGLALGIAAIAFRPMRPVLAILAAVASALAMVAVVGTLLAAMIPLYQAPRDLGLVM